MSPAFDRIRGEDGRGFPLTDKSRTEADWWLAELLRRVDAVCALVHDYRPWLDREYVPLGSVLKDDGTVAIARGVAYIDELDGRLQRAWSGKAVDQAEIYLIEKLRSLLPMARERQAALTERLKLLTHRAEQCAALMDFAWLIEPSRGILSIGYMVESEELHKACYDLLCSEARIGAFVAVARGDASQQSWFKLGRHPHRGVRQTGVDLLDRHDVRVGNSPIPKTTARSNARPLNPVTATQTRATTATSCGADYHRGNHQE